MTIYELIEQERARQVLLWGVQEHLPGTWMLILVEEVGEAAKAFLEGDPKQGCTELIQCMAVIMTWLEFVLRNTPGIL